MKGTITYSDDLRAAQIVTSTYFPPRGKHLARASSTEFTSFLIAYIRLWLARHEACDQQLGPRDNPVSMSHFHSIGILDHILLWMWYQGHVDYCLLTAPDDPPCYEHTSQANLLFTRRSSFWLTDRGDVFANTFFHDALAPEQDGVFEAAWSKLLLGQLLPNYNVEDRIFHWGAHLLKWFRQPAENQELVLRAEQELDWPRWMDDPLPTMKGKNPKIRVHNTLKDLNRYHHVTGLVHFQGDGTGTRIGWRYPQCVAQALSYWPPPH